MVKCNATVDYYWEMVWHGASVDEKERSAEIVPHAKRLM